MKRLLLPLVLLSSVSCSNRIITYEDDKNPQIIVESSHDYRDIRYYLSRKDAIELIKKFESFKPNIYKCPSGKRTIGYGLTGKYLKGRTSIDKQTAEYELELIYDEIYSKIRLRLSQNLEEHQIAALVSFAFNLGEQALYDSTMFNYLKSGNLKIDDEITRFVYAKHPDTGEYIKLKGLELRRKEELMLFNITSTTYLISNLNNIIN